MSLPDWLFYINCCSSYACNDPSTFTPLPITTSQELLKDHLIGKTRALDIGSGSGYFSTLMARLMDTGYVYGLNSLKKLTNLSINNVNKNNYDTYDDGRIVLLTGTKSEGLQEFSPFDCINIGYVVEDTVPR